MSYITVKGPATGEITEKKSRFIATLVPVTSEDEATAFINECKKRYWDARHNCSAYIIMTDTDETGRIKSLERSSDDGEPSRTAGVPMLEVIRGAGLCNVAVVVTRYFGGILLGTGGLVRAYQDAVKEALSAAETVTLDYLNSCLLVTDYTGYGRFQYFAAQENIKILNTEYTDAVRVEFAADDIQLGSLDKKMTEASGGACKIEVSGKGWY